MYLPYFKTEILTSCQLTTSLSFEQLGPGFLMLCFKFPFQNIVAIVVVSLLVTECYGDITKQDILSAIRKAKRDNAAKRLTKVHRRVGKTGVGKPFFRSAISPTVLWTSLGNSLSETVCLFCFCVLFSNIP